MFAALAFVAALAGAPVRASDPAPAIRLTLNNDRRYLAGDRARVQVTTDDDGYVLVLHVDTDGRLRVLFPLDPGDDNYLRGGHKYELRGRGGREAFTPDANGRGFVYAAYSRAPMDFTQVTLGDHWDYRALAPKALPEEPEPELNDLARRMIPGRFDYDLVNYDVGEQTYAAGGGYAPAPATYAPVLSSYDSWCNSYYYGTAGCYPYSWGFFGVSLGGFSIGYSSWDPYYSYAYGYGYNPYWYGYSSWGYRPWYRYSYPWYRHSYYGYNYGYHDWYHYNYPWNGFPYGGGKPGGVNWGGHGGYGGYGGGYVPANGYGGGRVTLTQAGIKGQTRSWGGVVQPAGFVPVPTRTDIASNPVNVTPPREVDQTRGLGRRPEMVGAPPAIRPSDNGERRGVVMGGRPVQPSAPSVRPNDAGDRGDRGGSFPAADRGVRGVQPGAPNIRPNGGDGRRGFPGRANSENDVGPARSNDNPDLGRVRYAGAEADRPVRSYDAPSIRPSEGEGRRPSYTPPTRSNDNFDLGRVRYAGPGADRPSRSSDEGSRVAPEAPNVRPMDEGARRVERPMDRPMDRGMDRPMERDMPRPEPRRVEPMPQQRYEPPPRMEQPREQPRMEQPRMEAPRGGGGQPAGGMGGGGGGRGGRRW